MHTDPDTTAATTRGQSSVRGRTPLLVSAVSSGTRAALTGVLYEGVSGAEAVRGRVIAPPEGERGGDHPDQPRPGRLCVALGHPGVEVDRGSRSSGRKSGNPELISSRTVADYPGLRCTCSIGRRSGWHCGKGTVSAVGVKLGRPGGGGLLLRDGMQQVNGGDRAARHAKPPRRQIDYIVEWIVVGHGGENRMGGCLRKSSCALAVT